MRRVYQSEICEEIYNPQQRKQSCLSIDKLYGRRWNK